MMMTHDNLDNIILGDNQFFGINHLSSEKGLARAIHFQDVNNVIRVMEWAYELGAGGVMLSTHPRIGEICLALKASSNLRNSFNVYPNIPYIAKYVRDVNEKGLMGLLFDTLSRNSFKDKVTLMLRGGKNLIDRDFFDLFKILIDLEMTYFSGLRVKAVFIHNVLVDLALGLGLQEVFEFFSDYMSSKYGVLAGFGTLNLPKLIVKLNKCGFDRPLIMASFNKKHLYMNPSRTAYEECAKNNDFYLVANGVLASGALQPDEAFSYLFAHKKKDVSVAIGASSRGHLAESIGLLQKHYGVRSI